MATGNPARRELGFSLVELMIAMVATLVITGAVMQLVGAGKGAFRREPEVSDRQQNIRMAMSLINRDVQNAGVGFPPFSQVFRTNLNAIGPTAPSGARADELEIVSATDCPPLLLCRSQGVNVDSWESLPACYNMPNMIALWNATEYGIFWGESSPNGNQSCNGAGGGSGGSGGGGSGGGGNGGGGNGGGNGGGGNGGGGTDRNGHVTMPPGQNAINPSGGPGFTPTHMGLVNVMRYRIVVDADGVPNLWRSPYGGFDVNGQSSWQLVARGIEDLQVSYRNGSGANWLNNPGTVALNNYSTIVRQVRVTLSGRATAANLQGATTSTAGGTRIRGQLQQEMAPRAALIALTSATGTNKWY